MIFEKQNLNLIEGPTAVHFESPDLESKQADVGSFLLNGDKKLNYKLKSNLKEFHEFFDDSVSIKKSILEETRNVKKDHALLVVCGFFNADDTDFNGPEDKRPCFSERIVARIWRRHRAYWVAEVWHQIGRASCRERV